MTLRINLDEYYKEVHQKENPEEFNISDLYSAYFHYYHKLYPRKEQRELELIAKKATEEIDDVLIYSKTICKITGKWPDKLKSLGLMCPKIIKFEANNFPASLEDFSFIPKEGQELTGVLPKTVKTVRCFSPEDQSEICLSFLSESNVSKINIIHGGHNLKCINGKLPGKLENIFISCNHKYNSEVTINSKFQGCEIKVENAVLLEPGFFPGDNLPESLKVVCLENVNIDYKLFQKLEKNGCQVILSNCRVIYPPRTLEVINSGYMAPDLTVTQPSQNFCSNNDAGTLTSPVAPGPLPSPVAPGLAVPSYDNEKKCVKCVIC